LTIKLGIRVVVTRGASDVAQKDFLENGGFRCPRRAGIFVGISHEYNEAYNACLRLAGVC